MIKKSLLLLTTALLIAACGGSKKSQTDNNPMAMTPIGPTFQADSAYRYCEEQCLFGPRTMNSEAHELCAQWISAKFSSFGLEVTQQKADLHGYDGTLLRSTNIIASYRPELTSRLMLCAHWDSRPWADNDPDEANWHTPVMAANDGASGVAVMMEVARQLPDTLDIGIDFICFDAEDWGVPQWAETSGGSDSWALGAQYWAEHPHKEAYKARYGILLDMVGGQGARFFHELNSLQYAPTVVRQVWKAAEVVGFGSMFPRKNGGMITDDHVPVNQVAGIPCIDIIPYYPDCEASSFGPTWHTVNDDMQHIDRSTLQAVGQTLIQVIFSEAARQ